MKKLIKLALCLGLGAVTALAAAGCGSAPAEEPPGIKPLKVTEGRLTDEDGNPIASFSWDIDLDDLEKSLNISDENVEKAKGIWDKAKDLGLIDIITDKDTTDESIEKYVTEHSGELVDLAKDAIDLLADILGEI